MSADPASWKERLMLLGRNHAKFRASQGMLDKFPEFVQKFICHYNDVSEEMKVIWD